MSRATESASRAPEKASRTPESASRTPEKASRTGGVGRGVAWGLAVVMPLAFLGLFFAYPVATLVGRGFVTDGALDLGGFAEVLGAPRTWRVVWFTLWQAVVSTLLTIVVGLAPAYVFARYAFRGRALLLGLMTALFVLPTVVMGAAVLAVPLTVDVGIGNNWKDAKG